MRYNRGEEAQSREGCNPCSILCLLFFVRLFLFTHSQRPAQQRQNTHLRRFHYEWFLLSSLHRRCKSSLFNSTLSSTFLSCLPLRGERSRTHYRHHQRPSLIQSGPGYRTGDATRFHRILRGPLRIPSHSRDTASEPLSLLAAAQRHGGELAAGSAFLRG